MGIGSQIGIMTEDSETRWVGRRCPEDLEPRESGTHSLGTAESLRSGDSWDQRSAEGLAHCGCALLCGAGLSDEDLGSEAENDSLKERSLERAGQETDLGIVTQEPVISTLIWQR